MGGSKSRRSLGDELAVLVEDPEFAAALLDALDRAGTGADDLRQHLDNAGLAQTTLRALHDLSSMATVIQLGLEELDAQLAPLVAASGRDRVRRVSEFSDTLDSLVEAHGNVVQLLRDTRNLTATATGPCSPATLLRSVERLYRRARHDVVVDPSRGSTNAHVSLRRVDLMRVVLNLVDNALEALGKRSDGRITLRCWDAMANVYIEVADNGPGLPGTDLLDAWRTGHEGGSGLGLDICQRIVARGGGELEVNSDDVGTRIVVVLPAEPT